MVPASPSLVLSGGGARAAYQVGFLRGLVRQFPTATFPVITGVSAGAINAAHLANCTKPTPESVERLVELWRSLTVDQVFRTDLLSLGSHMVTWALRLISGGRVRFGSSSFRGMLDTLPLREFLQRALATPDGRLHGITENLRSGRLDAIGITTTNYGTGQSVTWVEGRDVVDWERPGRRSRLTALTVDHVLASCALPLLFPGVKIEQRWHGDGGVQLTAPLSPALHLGSDRILAVSTSYNPTSAEADNPTTEGYPPPATIVGLLLDAIFLDMLDCDAQVLRRTNRMIRLVPDISSTNLRPVELLLVRPSQDLGLLANDYEHELPAVFRFMMRGLGTERTRRGNLLATLLFQPGYIARLLEIGERDAMDRHDQIARFLAVSGAREEARPLA
ncbi:MAG: patatin-like phospholipase family protein [Opitutaceae bacterium]|nr:patatin-like phospholipase family protein [Opitutaceae bacterium]